MLIDSAFAAGNVELATRLRVWKYTIARKHRRILVYANELPPALLPR
jgi:hypothetical protein